MDERKTTTTFPVKKKLGLPEICDMITIAEARLGRILSPVDFGHDDVIRRTNPEISLPSLSELRRALSIGEDDSAYSFVMRAIGHTQNEIMRAIHRNPPRRSATPGRMKLVSVPEEQSVTLPESGPRQEPEKPPVIQRAPEPEKIPEAPAPKPVGEKPKLVPVVDPKTIPPRRTPSVEKLKEEANAVRPLRQKRGWGERIEPIKKPESQ